MGTQSTKASSQGVPIMPLEDFKRDYTVGEVLGRGGFSTVCRATSTRQSGDVALKLISKSHHDFSMKAIRKELNLLQKISHPGCVNLLDFFQVDKNIVVVQEVANGQDLHERLCRSGPLNSQQAAFVLGQLLDTLQYLHSIRICHRDLKPENILMVGNDPSSQDYWRVKIGDFGLSTDEADGYKDVMTTVVGTPEFSAPECLRIATGGRGRYSCKADVWSLGAILYTMLSATQPFIFNKGEYQHAVRRVCEGQYTFSDPVWQKVEREAIQAVMGMMTPSSEKRPTIQECRALPWVARWEAMRPKSDVHIHSSRKSDTVDWEGKIRRPSRVHEVLDAEG